MSRVRPSICFVAPTAYAALSGREDLPYFGGAQIQQVLIARELTRRGHRVSFIVLDHGQEDALEHDGIRAFKSCGEDDGWPGARFVHPRWTSLWRALDRADADIAYQRAAGSETGQVAMWCRLRERRFVFAAASNTDADAKLPYLRSRRERMFYRYGLRAADRVVAQTRDQVLAFHREFQIKADLIRSCSADPGAGHEHHWAADGSPSVLWVGRFSYEKRPEWVLSLARRCPRWRFDVVGAANAEAGGGCWAGGSLPANLTLHGRVPHSRMEAFYRRAAVLLLTSAWEGFPNTFLEAWARGLPVVSTVDPDGVIADHGLGAVGRTVADLESGVEWLVGDPDAWHECSRRVRAYFVEHHSIAAAADAYQRLLAELAGGGAGRRGEAALTAAG